MSHLFLFMCSRFNWVFLGTLGTAIYQEGPNQSLDSLIAFFIVLHRIFIVFAFYLHFICIVFELYLYEMELPLQAI